MRLTREQWVLLAILGLGLFLRIYDLAGESLWLDEVVSIRLAHEGVSAIVKNRASSVHPPFYFLLLRYWVALFGDSEFATRFLSVLFGFGAMWMVYKVGKQLFDKEVGLLASLLMAVSSFHIRYSQEVRAYGLMALLTLLSFYFFGRFLEERNRWTSIGYVLFTAFLVYTHVYGLFIVIAENLYFATLFLFSREDFKSHIKRWTLLQSCVALLFAPWIPMYVKLMIRSQGHFWLKESSFDTIRQSFEQYAGSEKLMFLLIGLAFLSLITWNKTRESSDWAHLSQWPRFLGQRVVLTDLRPIYLLGLWLLVPIVLPFLISQVSSPMYKFRYAVAASLALYLLAAKGIKNLAYAPAKLIITGIIIFLSLSTVWTYYVKVQKEQWREAAKYVEARAQPGDLVLFNTGYSRSPFNYYSKRADLIKKSFPKGTPKHEGETIEKLAPTLRDHERVWLILSHAPDEKGLTAKTLGKTFPLSDYRKFRGIEIYLFQKTRNGKGPERSLSNRKALIICQIGEEVSIT
jgi:uncharacterized membrane protein